MTRSAVVVEHAARVPALEGWLDARGVAWVFDADFDLAGIDVTASVLHQARTELLDEEVVERYAADMARGDVFPAIVVAVRDGGGALLAGGNHRVAGAKAAARRALPAYVLDDVDHATLLELTIEDNRRHGLPLTEVERLRLLVRLVNVAGRTQAQAAAICGVSQVKASRALSVDHADGRARRLDVAGWASLPATQRSRIDAVGDDTVFGALARLAVERRPGPHAIDDLVRACDGAESPKAALALIGAEDDYLASGRAGAPRPSQGRPSHRAQLAGAAITIGHLDARKVLEQLSTPGERRELARQITDAARVLQQVMVGIERAQAGQLRAL